MKWLIAGLGNPGKRYDNTRHNAGFLVVDELVKLGLMDWSWQDKFDGEIAEKGQLIFLKPGTFMNGSGLSVGRVADYFRVSGERTVIVHDDLDLTLGFAKVTWAKGPHIHNGVTSVEQTLKTKDFWRVRVGVDSRSAEDRRLMSGEEYVLKQLDYTEKKQMRLGVEKATKAIEDILGGKYVNCR